MLRSFLPCSVGEFRTSYDVRKVMLCRLSSEKGNTKVIDACWSRGLMYMSLRGGFEVIEMF